MKNKCLILTLAAFLLSCNSFSNGKEDILSPIITQEIVEAAQNCPYDFDPTKVVVQEKEAYDYSSGDLINLENNETRNNHHLVFKFEGKYNEGYGISDDTFGNMFLWDDGLYYAKLGEKEVKGYWFNVSMKQARENKDVPDCLVLISNEENYERYDAEKIPESSLSESSERGFEYRVEMYLSFSWGQRKILMSGYYYYPDIAISFRNYLKEEWMPKYKVGDYFLSSNYSVVHIMKNLNYIPVLDENDVTWTIPDDMLNQDSKFYKTGVYSVKVEYKTLVSCLTVDVK